MNQLRKIAVAALLLVPATAYAQKPSNTLETRSALLYLSRAEAAQHPADREKFLKQAFDLAVTGTQKDPGNSKAWFTLGQIYTVMGNAAGVDTAFDKAEQMWPDYAKETEPLRYRVYAIAFNNGVEALKANNTAAAVTAMEAAETVWPKVPTAALNLGSIYARTNQMDKAVVAYRRALTILTGPERKAQNEAGQKQWAEWEEAASFNLAQLLAGAGKNDEAAAAYEMYLKNNPNSSMAKSNLAIVYSRMGKTEDATRIYNDLLGQDLPAEDYFAVGVGLFRGQQFDQASQAFRKAITKNVNMRDAYYNLAQSLYSMISNLEEARGKAKIADQKPMEAQLRGMYEELYNVTEKARALDPNNRNVLALLARAYRGLSDVTDAKVESDKWKAKTLEVLSLHEAMPIEVANVTLVADGAEAKLAGEIINLKTPEGQPIKLNVTFFAPDGTSLSTQEVVVTAPKAEEQVPFSATFKTDKPVAGWKYELIK